MTVPVLLLATGAGRCAVRVADTAGVRRHEGLEALPDALPGVAGFLREADGSPMPVLSPFGDEGLHVVVLEASDGPRFGLVVGEVEGIVRLADDELGPPPAGQRTRLVEGVAGGDARGALLLDVARLAEALAR